MLELAGASSKSQDPVPSNTTMSPRWMGAQMVDDLVDEHPVADLEGVLHRGGRDVERLDHEGLDDEREHQRDHDEHRKLAPEAALALGAPGRAWRRRAAAPFRRPRRPARPAPPSAPPRPSRRRCPGRGRQGRPGGAERAARLPGAGITVPAAALVRPGPPATMRAGLLPAPLPDQAVPPVSPGAPYPAPSAGLKDRRPAGRRFARPRDRAKTRIAWVSSRSGTGSAGSQGGDP